MRQLIDRDTRGVAQIAISDNPIGLPDRPISVRMHPRSRCRAVALGGAASLSPRFDSRTHGAVYAFRACSLPDAAWPEVIQSISICRICNEALADRSGRGRRIYYPAALSAVEL